MSCPKSTAAAVKAVPSSKRKPSTSAKSLRPFTTYCRPASTVTATTTAKYRASRINDIFGYSISPAELRACDLQASGIDGSQPMAMRRIGSAHRMLQEQQKVEKQQQTEDSSRQQLGETKTAKSMGARELYLSARHRESPRDKYYYPEATSWRIGWVQRADDEAPEKV